MAGYLELPGKPPEEAALSADLQNAYQAWDRKFEEALKDLKSESYNPEVHLSFLNAIDNELTIVNEILDGLIGLQGRIAKQEFDIAEQALNAINSSTPCCFWVVR